MSAGPPIRAAILTVSDRCSRGEMTDTAGPALGELLTGHFGGEVVATACVPDEAELIAARLLAWAGGDAPPDLILTTGGTGLSPRDVTPEATLHVIERRHGGLAELIRARCGARFPKAYLSRGEAGVIGAALIINLPGSRRGAVESLEAIADVLPHAIRVLRGDADLHEPPPSAQ